MTKLKTLFSYEPREGLYRSILLRIDMEKVRQAKRKFVIFAFSSAASFVASAAAFQYVIAEFGKSEFVQYFSLIFSDSQTVISYWREFVVLLTESLPVFGLTLFLTTAFITLFSFRGFLKNFTVVDHAHAA